MGVVRINREFAGLQCCHHRCCWLWAVTVAQLHRRDHHSLIKKKVLVFLNNYTINKKSGDNFSAKKREIFLLLLAEVSEFSVKAVILRFCLASLCLQAKRTY